MRGLVEGEISWVKLSCVVALMMGFRPTAEPGVPDTSGVKPEWKTNVASPPLLDVSAPLLDALEADLPEPGSDARAMYKELVCTIVGAGALEEAERAGDSEFLARFGVAEWILHAGDFLQGETSEAK